MADHPAAIQGSFADYKLVKTRSVLQLVIEVPVENQAEVFAALGYPMPGEETHVAVARLQNLSETVDELREIVADAVEAGDWHDEPPPASDPMKAARTRAVLLCKDERFQNWALAGRWILAGMEVVEAAKWMRSTLRIDSRREIATDRDTYKRFLLLEARYKAETGQMAEERG